MGSTVPLEKSVIPRNPGLTDLWKYPDNLDFLSVKEADILPIRPIIKVDLQRSRNLRSQRKVTFKLLNSDIIEMFCTRSAKLVT